MIMNTKDIHSRENKSICKDGDCMTHRYTQVTDKQFHMTVRRVGDEAGEVGREHR